MFYPMMWCHSQSCCSLVHADHAAARLLASTWLDNGVGGAGAGEAGGGGMTPSLFRIILQIDGCTDQPIIGQYSLTSLVIGSYFNASGLLLTLPALASVMALSTSTWIRFAWMEIISNQREGKRLNSLMWWRSTGLHRGSSDIHILPASFKSQSFLPLGF